MGGVCAAYDEEEEVRFKKKPQEEQRIITVDTRAVPKKRDRSQPPPGFKFDPTPERKHERVPSELTERQTSGPYSRDPKRSSRFGQKRDSRREPSRSQTRGNSRAPDSRRGSRRPGSRSQSHRPSRSTVRSTRSEITNADETRMKIAVYLDKKGGDAPPRPSLLYKNKQESQSRSFIPTEYRRSLLKERNQRGFSMIDARRQGSFRNVQRTQSLRRSHSAHTTRKYRDLLSKQVLRTPQQYRNSRQPAATRSKSAFSESDSGHQTVSPSQDSFQRKMASSKTRPVQKSRPKHSDRLER